MICMASMFLNNFNMKEDFQTINLTVKGKNMDKLTHFKAIIKTIWKFVEHIVGILMLKAL